MTDKTPTDNLPEISPESAAKTQTLRVLNLTPTQMSAALCFLSGWDVESFEASVSFAEE